MAERPPPPGEGRRRRVGSCVVAAWTLARRVRTPATPACDVVRHKKHRRRSAVILAASPAQPRSGEKSLQRASLACPPLLPRCAVLIRALASLPPTGQMMKSPRKRPRQRRRRRTMPRQRHPPTRAAQRCWTRTSRAHRRWKLCAVCECVRMHACRCASPRTRTQRALARTRTNAEVLRSARAFGVVASRFSGAKPALHLEANTPKP